MRLLSVDTLAILFKKSNHTREPLTSLAHLRVLGYTKNGSFFHLPFLLDLSNCDSKWASTEQCFVSQSYCKFIIELAIIFIRLPYDIPIWGSLPYLPYCFTYIKL